MLKRVFGEWQGWPWSKKNPTLEALPGALPGALPEAGADHLTLARESLTELLHDARLPDGVRAALSQDYQSVQAMLDKLAHGHLHIAVFGRVSTGKSSLLNALIGEERFAVSPLHGETKLSSMQAWQEEEVAGVYLIDTPGLDEAGGEVRESMAREVSQRSDLVLFVLDSDITDSEHKALTQVVNVGRPVIVVLNKADLYSSAQTDALLDAIRQRVADIVAPAMVVTAAAQPRPATVVTIAADGQEAESQRSRPADVVDLKLKLWDIIQQEGKTLAALNASLFAADLSDQVGRRILIARRELGERVIRTYCLGKGAAVAINPVPVADLFAAAFIDIGMIVHLSRVYNLPLNRAEAGSLVKVIITEAAALMGTVWAVHLVSSALKLGTGGLSTVITAGAQGAVAYYSTYVVGQVAEEYLASGKSWGDGGPKRVVQKILDSLDRDSILQQGRDEIRARLKIAKATSAK